MNNEDVFGKYLHLQSPVSSRLGDAFSWYWLVWHNDICLIYDDIVPQKPDI